MKKVCEEIAIGNMFVSKTVAAVYSVLLLRILSDLKGSHLQQGSSFDDKPRP